MDDVITMAHGSGGRKTSELIDGILVPMFSNGELDKLNDGAYLSIGEETLVFSTDSFVIKPIFFPGGDIGKLSICGTINDISACGGVPKFLSLSFIIEEGFSMESFRRIVCSIKDTGEKCGVEIVTGDTKVVERGCCDGIYINTSGIGTAPKNISLGPDRIRAGDKVLVTGTMGDHGLAVMAAREKLFEGGGLVSDCAPMKDIAQISISLGDGLKVMRDPTRGGLGTTLKEFVENRDIGIRIRESQIPVKPKVRGACEILGIDPLYAANEGKLVMIAGSDICDELLNKLRRHPLSKDAAVIGEVVSDAPGKLLLETEFGSTRIIDKLSGNQLPRIC